jgi:hypothetical protein
MNEDLRKWFKERWVDISRKKKGGGHPECGASADKGVRAKDSSRKYPKCVPANKAKSMTKKEKKSAVNRKRRAPNEPGSPDNVRTDVQKENWEKWRPSRDKAYSVGVPSNNAPEDPKPMGGAVAFEKSRKEVLSQLKEYIQYLIAEQTVAPKFRAGKKVAAPPQVDSKQQTLERLFNLGKFTQEDVFSIVGIFYDILTNNEIEKYVDVIESLPNIKSFNKLIDNIDNPRLAPQLRSIDAEQKENFKKIVGKLSSGIDAELEKRTREKQMTSEPATSSKPSRKSEKQRTVDVSRETELLGSVVLQNAIKEKIKELQQSGIQSPEITKAINSYTNFIAKNKDESPEELAANIRSMPIGNIPYLGAPVIPQEKKGIADKIKGFFGLNEIEAVHMMEKYDIRTEKDFDILLEAVVYVILKEGK